MSDLLLQAHCHKRREMGLHIIPLQVFKNLLSDREARLRIIELSKNLSEIIKKI
jgi:hypothetical protein